MKLFGIREWNRLWQKRRIGEYRKLVRKVNFINYYGKLVRKTVVSYSEVITELTIERARRPSTSAGHCAKSILRGEPALNEESHTVRELE